MPQRFLLQEEDCIGIAACVNDAKDTNLACSDVMGNYMAIHWKGADVWPQMRFEALADVREPRKEPELVSDGSDGARRDTGAGAFLRNVKPDCIEVGSCLRRDLDAHYLPANLAMPRCSTESTNSCRVAPV